MSLKRKLATAAVISATAAVPFLSPAPAMAATADPYLDYFNTAVDLNELVDMAALSGCTTTFVTGVTSPKPGVPVVRQLIPQIVIDYAPTLTYTVAIESATVGYILCMV